MAGGWIGLELISRVGFRYRDEVYTLEETICAFHDRAEDRSLSCARKPRTREKDTVYIRGEKGCWRLIVLLTWVMPISGQTASDV